MRKAVRYHSHPLPLNIFLQFRGAKVIIFCKKETLNNNLLTKKVADVYSATFFVTTTCIYY